MSAPIDHRNASAPAAARALNCESSPVSWWPSAVSGYWPRNLDPTLPESAQDLALHRPGAAVKGEEAAEDGIEIVLSAAGHLAEEVGEMHDVGLGVVGPGRAGRVLADAGGLPQEVASRDVRPELTPAAVVAAWRGGALA